MTAQPICPKCGLKYHWAYGGKDCDCSKPAPQPERPRCDCHYVRAFDENCSIHGKPKVMPPAMSDPFAMPEPTAPSDLPTKDELKRHMREQLGSDEARDKAAEHDEYGEPRIKVMRHMFRKGWDAALAWERKNRG